MSAAKIRFENVSKEFAVRADDGGAAKRFVAVHDVTLDVRPGEFLVLVGPSGCGKSTLLDLLAGLALPTSGRVLIDGQPVTGPARDRGVVFQQYALFPWLSALDNVAFGLEVAGVGKRARREKAAHYLELVGLTDFANRFPHELSGGMKQRVAIARSLAYEPQVLLMDEPFAALDAQTREILQGELLRIWEQYRKTIVFITRNAAGRTGRDLATHRQDDCVHHARHRRSRGAGPARGHHDDPAGPHQADRGHP